MNYDQMFPSRFIKAGEFMGKPVTLTIGSVDREGLEREDGKEEQAAILTFSEARKNGDPIQMVLNKTNAQAIFAMWPDTDTWPGKRVTFYPEPDSTGMSDSGYCIRVQGSPDLEKAITYQEKLPRRKPKQKRLTKTTAAAAASQVPKHDPETGELATDPNAPEQYQDVSFGGFDDLDG